MRVRVSNVPISLDAALPENEDMRLSEIASALGVRRGDIHAANLERRSVDARKKTNVRFVDTVEVELADFARLRPAKGVVVGAPTPESPLVVPFVDGVGALDGRERPVVVGSGPAGLFCALYLARAGLSPIVIERGPCVEERVRAVERFDAGGELDVQANIQFGEGGAGTFSDGKLNTGTKSPHIRHVLREFVAAGAPDEILWQAKPHIGTDKLVDVVRNMRGAIIELGGEVRFNTLMTRLVLDPVDRGRSSDGDASVPAVAPTSVRAVALRDVRTGQESVLPACRVILACGHSARDTFSMLGELDVPMERKPFAVGVRIEHPQRMIDNAQYGSFAAHPALGPADYKLAVHTRDGRGVYTFCMCPGGQVVAAASEVGGVCVNGMSRYARDGEHANSALLVSVNPEDFPGDDVLAGVEFQRELERAAYDLGGGGYVAPAQTVGAFLGQLGEHGEGDAHDVRLQAEGGLVRPTYPRGVAWRDLRMCLPSFVTEALEEALPLLDRKLKGFAHPQAVMTAVEARSSSPVRIMRGSDFQSAVKGLYPCGEGAGYAGGITSAAVDGLRVAEAIVDEIVGWEGRCDE